MIDSDLPRANDALIWIRVFGYALSMLCALFVGWCLGKRHNDGGSGDERER